MKKWLAMLLSIVLTVQLAVPAWAADGGAEHETVASAVESGTCGDNLTWTLDGGVLVISGTGAMTVYSSSQSTWAAAKIRSVVIESGVTSIGYSAFSSCSNLTSVEIPDSVTSIGDYAFSNCSSLASIAIPNSITSIGQGAFSGCSRLTSITIPDSVTNISPSAFSSCSGLTSITIPDGVTSIGSGAFQWCSRLTSITIPDSVKSIGNSAFYGSNLTDVYYGGSRTEWNEILIGGDNDQLTGANIHCTKTDSTATTGASGRCGVNLTWILTDDGTLTISGTGVMHNYDSFGDAPWYGKRSMIKCLIIEPGVANIGDYAFRNCTNLTSVEIPDSVTIIRFNAFNSCNSLSSITIPNSVKTIDQAAFPNCSSLTSITIPDSVTRIGTSAFHDCSALTDVYYGGSRAEWNKIRIEEYNDQLTGATIHYAKTDPTATPTQTPMPTPIATPFPGPTATPAEPSVPTSGTCGENLIWKIEDGVLTISGTGAMTDYSPIQGPQLPWAAAKIKSVVIESGVTSIGDFAFVGQVGLTSITIPDNVTSIGDYAFSNCSSLASIAIPNSITSIGQGAFSGCSSLTSITIPDSVTNISPYAFSSCSGLTSVEIPDSVTSIGEGAFRGCTGLTSVEIPDSVTNIGEGAFCGCAGLADDDGFVIVRNILCGYFGKGADVAVPTGVTKIDMGAFEGCSSLVSIAIPDSVTSIGQGAFSGCSSLKSITIPDSVTCIGDYTFFNCSSLTSVKIPDRVTSIGSHAFYGCNSLTSVTVPEGVTSIGSLTFSGCTSLTSVTIPASMTSIGEGAFYGCAGLADDKGFVIVRNMLCGYFGKGADVVVPTGVTKIDISAFTGCRSLTSITIPDSVTSIGQGAFSVCTSLTSIAIPDSVTSIGDQAFYNCSSLASIAIPNSITSIGQGAFSGCSSLTSITIPDGVTSIGSNIFYGCSSLKSITIPDSVTTICSDAFRNCTSLTSATIPASMASIGSHAFYKCTALKDVYYSGCSETKWNSITVGSDNDPLKNATIHYSDHRWDEGVITKLATRTEEGEKTFTCTICQTTRTETIPALTPEPDSVDLNEIAKDFDGSSIGVDVDGKTVYPDGEGNYPRLTVPEGTTTLISVSTCNLPEGVDPHTRYPVSMAVYKATNTDGTTSVERISEMDDLLRYAGSSIRITGNKGIRLITGINASLKSALTSEGVAGYTLEEYGTLLCWASEVQNGSLSLSDAYARHNYAYSLANGTDPVFRYAGDVVQYTNVLVGFSNEQCVDDIAMRPYITLRDADGNTYTLYGGIVNRSIGYIAYQNRGAFTPGTNAYNYIWDIIHFVYGDAYDEDYKG